MSACVTYPPARSSEPPTTSGASGVRKSIDIGSTESQLEHLDVEAEVRSEVASRHDGQRDALEAVHGQRDEEEQGGASPRLDAALEAS